MAVRHIRFIFPILQPLKTRIALLLLLSLFHSVAGIFLIRLGAFQQSTLPFFLLSTLLLGVILSFVEELLIIPAAAHVGKSLWAQAFSSLLRLPRDKVQLDLLKKAESEAAWVSDWVISILRTLFRRTLQIGLFTTYLIILDWRLTAAVIPFFGLFFLVGWLLGRKTGALRRSLFKAEGDLSRFQTETVVNAECIKGYDAENFINENHDLFLGRMWSKEISHRRFHALYAPLGFLIMAGGVLAAWLLGRHLFSLGTISLSTVASYITGLVLLYPPLSGFGRDLVLAWSVREVPWLLELLTTTHKTIKRLPVRQSISLEKITHRYDAPVLTNFSATFPMGSVTGIRGDNGSGKTTLIHLLLGIIHPQRGSVRVDGTEALPMALEIGYLDQEGALFSGSAEMNLLLGRKIAPEERAPLLFSHRKGKLSSSSLSGGERRKIALDRALLTSPRVLILDEPEESLDAHSLIIVSDALKACKTNGGIVIVVSHHRDILALCDRIIEMEHS
ncbi:ABC transporter ATP-binding protein/permease [Myxococcota bacterium]|nr:ABC transporter ATP-binding protein/permease [Myxococcota bacterium]